MNCDFNILNETDGIKYFKCKYCNYELRCASSRVYRKCPVLSKDEVISDEHRAIMDEQMAKIKEKMAEHNTSQTKSQGCTPAEIKHVGPGFLQKAINFTKAASEHIRSGGGRCTTGQRQERGRICMGTPEANYEDACEKFQLGQEEPYRAGRCLECGCGINAEDNAVSKLNWQSSECPLKKWLKIESKS